jgi:hypothetical protein
VKNQDHKAGDVTEQALPIQHSLSLNCTQELAQEPQHSNQKHAEYIGIIFSTVHTSERKGKCSAYVGETPDISPSQK